MNFRIQEQSIDMLSEYGQVPIALEVKSRLRVELVDNGLGGIRLVEEPVDPPYSKNYDHSGGPERWTPENVGPLAVDCPRCIQGTRAHRRGYCRLSRRGLRLLRRARRPSGPLGHVRVRPEYQGRGVGRALFQRAETCAKQRGCIQLKIETQNINVPACRFYARMGAKLGHVHLYAYRTEGLDEVQLTWYKDL